MGLPELLVLDRWAGLLAELHLKELLQTRGHRGVVLVAQGLDGEGEIAEAKFAVKDLVGGQQVVDRAEDGIDHLTVENLLDTQVKGEELVGLLEQLERVEKFTGLFAVFPALGCDNLDVVKGNFFHLGDEALAVVKELLEFFGGKFGGHCDVSTGLISANYIIKLKLSIL